MHYLVDIPFAGKLGSEESQLHMQIFQELAEQLGVLIDAKKEFCALPPDKVKELLRCLKVACSVIGRSCWDISILPTGMAFVRRTYNAIQGTHNPGHKILASGGIADLHIWIAFLRDFNGISFWHLSLLLEVALQISSDVAGSINFGVCFQCSWCTYYWPEGWVAAGLTRNLTFLELFSS